MIIYRLKSKKLIFLILSIILLLFIPILIYFLLYFQKIDDKNLNKEIGTTVKKYNHNFNQEQISRALTRLNDDSLPDSERYKALEQIVFYFSTAYSASHEPELRAHVESLKTFAKNNFPKYYIEENFTVGCADPSCGEKPDEEMKKIQKEINEAGIRPEYLNTINKNLEQAIYIPNEQMDDKKYGFGLAIFQLKFENNPKASAAAQRLIDYLKRKYSIEGLGEVISEL
ncbi:MAG: hypothetical protein US51_C0008G0002 [Microgenomates group bacterium GW2011_GWA2_37_6]|nr:MAG: hypothetical protein US51_C0008G0002 [Microgenomates group bacterium GW2011_GWA2_37_6]